LKKNIKKEITNKYNKSKKFIIKKFKDFRKNPKREIITIINRITEIIKNNTLFFVYVITLLFNTILLRYFTIGTLENVFYYKPLLADLTIILLVGSVCFLLKEKNRFSYLLGTNIFLTLICIINSVYYTFYTSFSSISLLATSKYAQEVSDAIFENVLKISDLIYIWAPIMLIVTYVKLKKSNKIKKSGKPNKVKFMKGITLAGITGMTVVLTVTIWKLEDLLNNGIGSISLKDLVFMYIMSMI